MTRNSARRSRASSWSSAAGAGAASESPTGAAPASGTSATGSVGSGGHNGSTFPRKLAEMLGNEPEVLAWSQHGLSFFICDTDALTHQLLPKYFRRTYMQLYMGSRFEPVLVPTLHLTTHIRIPHTPPDNKLTSFQRQLNLYGFRRITKGADMGAYFHPQFRKDRPDLVARIRRLPGQVHNFCDTHTCGGRDRSRGGGGRSTV